MQVNNMDNTLFVEKPAVSYKNGAKEIAIKVKKASKKTFKLELINYSTEYANKSDRCIISDDVIYAIDSKKNVKKNSKRKSRKNNKSCEEEVYTQLEMSMEDIEDSFDIISGDLFNYEQLEINMEETEFDSGDLFNYDQIEEVSVEYIERFYCQTSGDLFDVEQLEVISDDDIEKNMSMDNPDLFNSELNQFDFDEMNEEEMKIAEASMWNETGEVEFE